LPFFIRQGKRRNDNSPFLLTTLLSAAVRVHAVLPQ
jgi:hypothetical protein